MILNHGGPHHREEDGRRFSDGRCSGRVAKTGGDASGEGKAVAADQGEMMKRGHLTKPYKGIGDCFSRDVREEGFFCLWRGNQANVIKYFPTQVFNFAFRGYFQSLLGCSKEKDGYAKWFVGNVASGIAADASASLLLYHLGYACTRLGTDAIECHGKSKR